MSVTVTEKSKKSSKFKKSLIYVLGILLVSSSFLVFKQSFAQDRINLKSRGFSIIPPEGWKLRSAQSQSLVLVEPKYKNAKYRASIQVVANVGGKAMNAISAKQMADHISSKFPGRNSMMTDYRVLNYDAVNLADGRKGYIYYTEFTIRDTKLMQMHLYISSANKHFLVTYTDLPKYFEGDFTSHKMQTVWNSFQSIQLDSPTPLLFYENNKFLSVVIGILVLLTLFYFSRKVIFSSKIKKFSENSSNFDADIEMIEEDSFKTYKDTDEEEDETKKASDDDEGDDNFFSNVS